MGAAAGHLEKRFCIGFEKSWRMSVEANQETAVPSGWNSCSGLERTQQSETRQTRVIILARIGLFNKLNVEALFDQP